MADEKNKPQMQEPIPASNRKPQMPEQPITAHLPAMSDRAILEDLSRQARSTGEQVTRLGRTVDNLVHSHEVTSGQVGSINDRVGVIESKIYRIENPTVPPPPGITSERVRAEIERHPSKMDLETQAAVADAIVKQQSLETAIHETREIAEKTAREIKTQSEVMGIGKKGLEWLRSKQARDDIQRAVMLFGIVYMALKSMGIIK